MILFPLPSKNIRKEKHVSQGSKSATLSHGFPYTSYLLFFLNEVLVVEAMAKCWRNVRSEHLISSSQDTYRVFFPDWNHLSRNTQMWYEASAQQISSDQWQSEDSKIFRLLSVWEEGEAPKVQIPGQNCRCHVLNSSLLSKPSDKCPTAAHGETASVYRAWNAFGEKHGGAWKLINYTDVSDFLNVLSAKSSHAPLVLCTTVLGHYVAGG